MKDLLISWASGDSFCKLPEFRVFLESIRVSGMAESADIVILTRGMPSEIQSLITSHFGFGLLFVEDSEMRYVSRDRFLHYWNFLIEKGRSYKRVLHTDSKDVIFQSNPFEFLDQFSGEYVVFVPEGMKHAVSFWNMMDQLKSQRKLVSYRKVPNDWQVLNGGVFGGTMSKMRDFLFLHWSNCSKTIDPIFLEGEGCTDQAILNYLYHSFLFKDPSYLVLEPEENGFALLGEAVCQKYLTRMPMMLDNLVVNPYNNLPYCLFHQWERTEFKEALLEKYLNNG